MFHFKNDMKHLHQLFVAVSHPKNKHTPVTYGELSPVTPEEANSSDSLRKLQTSVRKRQKQANVAPYLNDKRTLLLLVPRQEFQSCMNILITKTWSQNNQHSQTKKHQLTNESREGTYKAVPKWEVRQIVHHLQVGLPEASVPIAKCFRLQVCSLSSHRGRKQQKQRFLWLVWLFFTHFVEAERPGRNP